MEPTFQTTFIPKKPLQQVATAEKPSGLIVFLNVIATLLVVASGAAYGILFVYKNQLTSSISNSNQSLERQSQTFESNLVVELDDINRRLQAAETLLKNHVVVSPLFKSLHEITLKTIKYNNFTFESQETAGKNILVKMSGTAQNYDSIALQSDMFAKNRFLKDPVFSNLVPDTKGAINFDLTFTVDPSFLLYKTYTVQ